jgi:hypothetical protein
MASVADIMAVVTGSGIVLIASSIGWKALFARR